ncbi:MAG: hypothetical protein RMJ97_10635 [Raineya sp.]|nr:DUF4834 family protein [Raineya sp.]MDW8297323.1 hypothetical protein [Raineya sp.]
MWKKILIILLLLYLFLRFARRIFIWLRQNFNNEPQRIHIHVTHEHIYHEKNKPKIKDEGEYVDFEEVK